MHMRRRTRNTAMSNLLERTMKTETGTFLFTVPETHSEAGAKKDGSFEYQVCDTAEEANQVIVEKEWDVKDIVNDILKANARSNAYQAATLPYRESKMTPESIRDRIIKDFIRSGLSEDVARKQVDALLGSK